MPYCLSLLEPLFLDGQASKGTFVEGKFVRWVVFLVCGAARVGFLHEPVDHCVTPRLRAAGLLHCTATLVSDGPGVNHGHLFPTTHAVPLGSVAATGHHHVGDALVRLQGGRVAVCINDL